MEEPKKRPKTGGRQKGTPNRKTMEIEKLLEEMDFNPIEFLVYVAMGNWKAIGYDTATICTGYTKLGDPIVEERLNAKLRTDAAKEVASYVFPKRKAIEHSGPGGDTIKIETLESYLKRTIEDESTNPKPIAN